MLYKDPDGIDKYWPILFYGKAVTENNIDGVFIYKLREPLFEAIKCMEEKGMFKYMIEEKNFDLNMILYGPPGTGKTYNSAIYAVAICDGKKIEELTDYDAVIKRYGELKKEHRIAFTTFHQSYGYEEFIEGIKPVVDGEGTELTYTIEPGVFKRFVKKQGNQKTLKLIITHRYGK